MATLTADMLALLESGTAHQVGACTAEHLPTICRALGVAVDAQGKVLAILSAESGFEVLAAVRTNARVSVNVTHPGTYKSFNLVGTDADVVPAAAWRSVVNQRYQAFQRELDHYGFPADYAAAFYGIPDDDLVAIRFTPIIARNQTPGIGAGEQMELVQ